MIKLEIIIVVFFMTYIKLKFFYVCFLCFHAVIAYNFYSKETDFYKTAAFTNFMQNNM